MICYQLTFFAIIGLSLGQTDDSKVFASDIEEYFQSDIIKKFKQQWTPQKKLYDSTIRAALYEQTGRKSMNIYLKSQNLVTPLTRGFLLTDNVVDLLLINLTMRNLPELILPEVSLNLHHNVLQIDTTLRKIFLDGHYLCFRYKSTVQFNEGAQSLLANSPFSFDQVYNEGEIAIIAENCILEGSALVTLLGYSVNLGLPMFKINDCKFTIEIYNSGFGNGPPVIVPYFSKEQRVQLHLIMKKPIVRAMTTLLQGILFSHMNTSKIFGKKLMKYRHYQDKLIKRSSDYMNTNVKELNKITVFENQGKVTFPDHYLSWDEKFDSFPGTTWIRLSNLRMYGLDTAYSSNRGGPLKTLDWKNSELIVFNKLSLQGIISCNQHNNANLSLEFGAALDDIGVSVTLNPEFEGRPSFQYEFHNWKPIEFYILDLEVNAKQRMYAHSYVNGYIMNLLPKILIDYLKSRFASGIKVNIDDITVPVDHESKEVSKDSCEVKGYVKKETSDNPKDLIEDQTKTEKKVEDTVEDSGAAVEDPKDTAEDSENVQNEIR